MNRITLQIQNQWEQKSLQKSNQSFPTFKQSKGTNVMQTNQNQSPKTFGSKYPMLVEMEFKKAQVQQIAKSKFAPLNVQQINQLVRKTNQFIKKELVEDKPEDKPDVHLSVSQVNVSINKQRPQSHFPKLLNTTPMQYQTNQMRPKSSLEKMTSIQ
ncbi:Hypothetical_protein [Hexamita inflata]|uniref:Hypothetical_protein n=1 Tax=Hexamita inflata TaxID=28002 RepID=A0AA86TR17_9EUKA|nr:Hypothetical protein HINF_LOCUS11207 [Hexamita inflata]